MPSQPLGTMQRVRHHQLPGDLSSRQKQRRIRLVCSNQSNKGIQILIEVVPFLEETSLSRERRLLVVRAPVQRESGGVSN